MRKVFFLLCIFSLSLAFYPSALLADTPLAAPQNPQPATRVPFVSLPLVLSWEDVPEAQSYRYELIGYGEWFQGKTQQEKDAWIKEWTDTGMKDWMEDGAQNGFLVALSQSNFFESSILKFLEPQESYSKYQELCRVDDGDKDGKIKNADGTPDECKDDEIRTFIKEQQRRRWHVKSCENSGGTKCGPWGDAWSFTYLLGPAVLKSPAAANATSVPLPVTFDWDDMPGAKSYDLILLPCPPWMTPDPKYPCYSISVLPQDTTLLSKFEDDACSFLKRLEYGWGVASCLDEQALFCTDPKDFNLQSFQISNALPPFNPPTPLQPLVNKDAPPRTSTPLENVPRVSKNDRLEWGTKGCAYFFRVNVFNEAGVSITNATCGVFGSVCTKDFTGTILALGDIENLWDQPEDLDKTYSWNVTPCWGKVGLADSTTPSVKGNIPLVADCPPATKVGADSEKWYFHTKGEPPILLAPADNTFTKIPILLSWQGNGVSYHYELSKDGLVNTDGSFQNRVAIPDEPVSGAQKELSYQAGAIMPGTKYWWRVKTCVDEKGDVCGQWSATSQFSTFPLLVPDTPNPSDGATMTLDQHVAWKAVDAANAYAYHLEYACRNEKENKEECAKYGAGICPDTSIKKTIEENKITAENSFALPYCMGQYEWKALACLQDKCQDPPETRTAWSNKGAAWTLTALQPPSSGAGLVPCSRPSNDDATPYDETEKCQLKHLGFLLQNLLDFILWKVSLATILVLAVITGATSYFSLGGPNALARIKTVFRSFFVGFLILVFAWMFVNIILMLLGFKFEFFGKWWEISF